MHPNETANYEAQISRLRAELEGVGKELSTAYGQRDQAVSERERAKKEAQDFAEIAKTEKDKVLPLRDEAHKLTEQINFIQLRHNDLLGRICQSEDLLIILRKEIDNLENLEIEQAKEHKRLDEEHTKKSADLKKKYLELKTLNATMDSLKKIITTWEQGWAQKKTECELRETADILREKKLRELETEIEIKKERVTFVYRRLGRNIHFNTSNG